MTFIDHSTYVHAQKSSSEVAVLLVNLGSPSAPTPQAVRPYLRQFLSDPRVVEIPRFIWFFILNGIIVPFRSKKSAKLYASIWREEGSPLAYWTQQQTEAVRRSFQEKGYSVTVDYAMRYGQDAIADKMQALQQAGIRKILVVPLYPQYAASSTASVIDEVSRQLLQMRHQPEVRFLKHFHDDARYIQTIVQKIQAHWDKNGRAEKLILSFHGIPKRSLLKGDPYFCECHKTGRLIREGLGLTEENCLITFQSRFGKAEWLQPYTEPTVQALAEKGVRSLDVFCPGFVSDCLETLEEIAIGVKETFLHHGGERFEMIPCLNADHGWMENFSSLLEQHLQGWPVRSTDLPDLKAIELRAQRALQLGATQ